MMPYASSSKQPSKTTSLTDSEDEHAVFPLALGFVHRLIRSFQDTSDVPGALRAHGAGAQAQGKPQLFPRAPGEGFANPLVEYFGSLGAGAGSRPRTPRYRSGRPRLCAGHSASFLATSRRAPSPSRWPCSSFSAALSIPSRLSFRVRGVLAMRSVIKTLTAKKSKEIKHSRASKSIIGKCALIL